MNRCSAYPTDSNPPLSYISYEYALTAMLKELKDVKAPVFDAQAFSRFSRRGETIVEYRKSQKIYSQGEPAKNVLYIQEGGIKLSVVNEVGKEAVVAMLGPGDFFGEGSLAGRVVRIGTAHRDHAHDVTCY